MSLTDERPLRLTPAELYEVTGYKRPTEQVAWIRSHYGIHAHVNAANEAVVIRAHLEAAAAPGQNPRSVPAVRRVV